MALPSALATLIATAVAIPIDSYRVRSNIDKNVARMEAVGEFRDRNYELEFKLKNAIRENWWGDKSMFPEKLIGFLEQDANARECYIECLAMEAVTAAGYKPASAPTATYNMYTYDCYTKYKRLYGDKELAWRRIYYPEEVAKEERERKELERQIEENLDAEARKGKALMITLGILVVLLLIVGLSS